MIFNIYFELAIFYLNSMQVQCGVYPGITDHTELYGQLVRGKKLCVVTQQSPDIKVCNLIFMAVKFLIAS